MYITNRQCINETMKRKIYFDQNIPICIVSVTLRICNMYTYLYTFNGNQNWNIYRAALPMLTRGNHNFFTNFI